MGLQRKASTIDDPENYEQDPLGAYPKQDHGLALTLASKTPNCKKARI